MAPVMPCKRAPSSIAKVIAKSQVASETAPKKVYGWKVESRESKRQRSESSQPKNHKDHLVGEGFISMSHSNLVHKFIPMPQAMKIPDAKGAVEKEWKKKTQPNHG